jgi:hypothetical protein
MNRWLATANGELSRNVLIYELAPERSFENFPKAVRTVILDQETKHVYINARISNREKFKKILKELQVVRAQELNPPCHSLVVDDNLELYVDVAWLGNALPDHAHYYSIIESIFRYEIMGEQSTELKKGKSQSTRQGKGRR